MKYLMVTKDRTQTTVFNGLLESFKYFNGVPRQLLFDNMRTIVDRSRLNLINLIIMKNYIVLVRMLALCPSHV